MIIQFSAEVHIIENSFIALIKAFKAPLIAIFIL